jgi:hypothetical protein
MSRSNGRRGRKGLAAVVSCCAFFGVVRTDAREEGPGNARLRQPRDRVYVAEAIRGAALRLGEPRCQELLDDFHDRSRRPLRDALEAEGLSAPEFLAGLYFYDGTEAGCGARRLAYTVPGYRVVYVCGDRFRELYQRNTSLAEVAIVHETLHCLGLGENPPTPQEINARVQEACRKQVR